MADNEKKTIQTPPENTWLLGLQGIGRGGIAYRLKHRQTR
jgi:hypothetical protein